MNTHFPETEKILGVPTKEPTKSVVPSPVDHEKINLGIAPGNQWYKSDTFCNTLPPAPRNQLINYPTSKNNCPTYKNPEYDPKKCYFTYNKDQNIPGIFCGGAGGTGNSNYVRGNKFSNDYCVNDFKNNSKNNVLSIGNNTLDIIGPKINSDEIDEYTDNALRPVQIKMENVLFKDNPTVVSDSPFYPYPNYNYTKNKYYMTYPHSKKYDNNGMPIYNYPYNTLFKSNNKSIIENFTDSCATVNHKSKGLWITVIVLLAILIVLYMVNGR